jgi:hypothetical protein
LYALCPRLSENAESGLGGMTTQTPWAATAGATTQTGSRAFTDSPAGNYASNANTSLTSPVIDLTGYENARLSFDSWCDTEPGFDFGNVETSINGGSTWSTAVFRCSGDAALRRVSIDLPVLNNAAQARIRFRFTSDTNTVDDGWYVDNIVLEAGGPACRATQTFVDPLFENGFEP